MNRILRRMGAAMLAGCLLTSASAAELPLADSLVLKGAYNEAVREQVLTYEPGGDVRPVVVYGNTLYGRSTMDYIQQFLSGQGYTAAAAINAAFFDMVNGIPYGMVVTDGILRTSGNVLSVGLYDDGSMQIGLPELEVKMGDITLNYNKALTKNSGFCLYSRDYDKKTKSELASYNLILEPEQDYLTLSCEVEATVKKIVTDTKSCDIPDGCFVLSLAMDTAYASAMETMKQFRVGDTVTIETSVDRDWRDVDYAVGGGDLLVEDGRALDEFDLETADNRAARTALGVRRNGDIVCYCAEKSASSEGLTLAQLAERMEDLNCEIAINLDGGGSAALGATYPGQTGFTTVNDPSDGKQRPCANFLFFVRETERAGEAVRLHVYPHDAAVLPGGSLEMTVCASDDNYMAASVPHGVSWSARGGRMSGSTFTAEDTGTATVTAAAGGLTGKAEIHVVETPTTITVRLDDEDVETLILEGGAAVDLTAEATYQGLPLAAQDNSFQWSVPERLGRISSDGVFTASEVYAKGTLQVSCGDLTVSVPVEVRPNPFADTKSHWAKKPISDLYYEGVLQGSANAQGEMLYRPDDSMTRQEFVAAMMRAQDVDPEDYADTDLPFADADQIAPWALDAMKAAYAFGYFTGSGHGDQLYAEPAATITREAAMTILARTIDAQSESDALEDFSDEKHVSDWARPALTAMVEKQIINGMDGKLLPQGSVTRAQVAKMLHTMR